MLHTGTLHIRAMHRVDCGDNEQTGDEKSRHGGDIVDVAEKETRRGADKKPVGHSRREQHGKHARPQPAKPCACGDSRKKEDEGQRCGTDGLR